MQIEVKVIKGKCQGGVHKIGEDTFTVDWATPEGVCLGAWNALSPCVIAPLCGGNFPWKKRRVLRPFTALIPRVSHLN